MPAPHEWSPRGAVIRVKQLEDLASEMIGDGRSPDVFFVTVRGNVVLVTTDFDLAHGEWEKRSELVDQETSLENRRYGVIASVGPSEDGGALERFDDSDYFLRREGRRRP